MFRYEEKMVGTYLTNVYEFDSLMALHEFLTTTKNNKAFEDEIVLDSESGSYSFTKTYSYEEAEKLFLYGWSEMAEELEQKLSLASRDVKVKMVNRMCYDVVGFQASIPRYIQGLPENMINNHPVVQKQKVITINKDVFYNCRYTTEEIIDNSVKALQIIKKAESQGYRVNLNVLFGAECGGDRFLAKIRIKNANERLNVSKTAFALVHPSMTRRICFRFVEKVPCIKDKKWCSGYGYPIGNFKNTNGLEFKGEYLLPLDIGNVNDEIRKMSLK